MTSSQQTGRDSVVTSSSQPDYATVNIPAKPPSEYTYHERRAELLQQIRDLGHPRMINQTEAAERYGVSQQQISKDLDRLAESVREHVTDPDRRTFTVDAVLQRSIQGLLAKEEYRKAAQTALEYEEWIREHVEAERFRARLERVEEHVDDGGPGR